MQAFVSEKLIDIAATVTSAIEAPAGGQMSATHAALLASRLFEAIKTERAALDPADLGTRALLDHALEDCKALTIAGDRMLSRLKAIFALLTSEVDHPKKDARRPRARMSEPPPCRLRLFRMIEGGRSVRV
jgi:hypothetical protein